MKSEFDPTVKLIGGQAFAGGSFSTTGISDLGVTTSKPVITWLIDQGGVCSSSVDVLEAVAPSRWDASMPAPAEWTDGPARAIACATIVTTDGVVSFAWTDEVELRKG